MSSDASTAHEQLFIPIWAWSALALVMFSLIAIDLITQRRGHGSTRRSAITWTLIWVGAALVFNLLVGLWFGVVAAEQFFAAYLLEKSLSIDNLFVFVVIFGALGIPRQEQRRVLTWGILGALVTRGLFIVVGAAVLERWQAVSYVFGAILIVTALRLLKPEPAEAPKQRLIGWLERHMRWTRTLHGHRFFVQIAGRWTATPLLLALIAIELTDVVFAIDSVPAAFAVTTEPFLVYSSNVFAILGLRALYSVLADMLQMIRYLRFGLAAILMFAGAKLFLARWLHVPPLYAIAVIVACLGIAVVASLLAARREARSGGHHHARPA